MDLHLRFLPNGICRVRLWIVWFNASKCFEKALFAHFKRSNTIPFYLVGNPRCSADSESRMALVSVCVCGLRSLYSLEPESVVCERERAREREGRTNRE